MAASEAVGGSAKAPDGDTADMSTELPLFVYGTLADPAVRANVLGDRPNVSARPAALVGYRRLRVPDFEYPLIGTGGPEDRVDGQLLGGLTVADYAILDQYEDVSDGLYARVRVTVTLEDGHGDAWAYVQGPALKGSSAGL